VQPHRQDARSGVNPRQRNSRQGQCRAALSKAETTNAGFTTGPTSPRSHGGMNLKAAPESYQGSKSGRGVQCSEEVSQLNLPPSKDARHGQRFKAAGRRQRSSARKYCAVSSQFMASFSHQPSGSGSAMSQVSREPNHSVNLTRNSVPHWPGIARYAHNAMPVQCVTLSHAGYLKR
jgi:hypothetical protein